MSKEWVNMAIDQKIRSIAERNAQLQKECEDLKVANKEVLSKTSTDQVS